MPIYAYKCDSCGFAKDVLQKLSDLPLTQCPSCGVASFSKQLTAAGFQLKGSGWYATDFKGGNTGAPASGEEKSGADGDSSKTEVKTDGKSDVKSDGKGDGKSEGTGGSKTETKKADAPVVKKPDATPVAGSGA